MRANCIWQSTAVPRYKRGELELRPNIENFCSVWSSPLPFGNSSLTPICLIWYISLQVIFMFFIALLWHNICLVAPAFFILNILLIKGHFQGIFTLPSPRPKKPAKENLWSLKPFVLYMFSREMRPSHLTRLPVSTAIYTSNHCWDKGIKSVTLLPTSNRHPKP